MLFRRDKKDRELNEEIAAHLRMAERDFGAETARRDFGNVGLVKEVTREMWGQGSIERFWQDVRYAVRVLGKNRGYALTAILSLAIGIGANTAIFSLIDAIMLESLPVKNPQELVSVGDPTRVHSRSIGSGGNVELFSYPFFRRFQKENGVFSDLYASGRTERLDLKDGLEHPQGRLVSNNFFSVLGVSLAQGRPLLAEDREAVVISDGFWQRHFGGAPNVVGQELTLNLRNFVIVGIAPRNFYGDVVGDNADLWLPIEAQPDLDPGHNYLTQANAFWLQLMGRPKPGVTLAQVSQAVNTLGIAIIREQAHAFSLPAELQGLDKKKIAVQSGAGGFSRIRHTFAPGLTILMALVALVLLISCVNVANLQMARAVSRGREMGLRLAIGANRARLVRQLLTESLTLAAAGGIAAVGAGYWISRLLLYVAVGKDGPTVRPHLNGMTLLFTAGVSLAAMLVFALAPALVATKGNVAERLRETKTGRAKGGAQRFEKGLVALEIVLSIALLYGSGLFVRTLQKLENSDVGYHKENLLIVQIDPSGSGYKDDQVVQLAKRLRAAIGSVPGVTRLTYSENGLFSGHESATHNEIEGFTPRSPGDEDSPSDRIGPNYFSTLGIPILAGREIGDEDQENGPKVVVVDEAFARFYFREGNALGRHISDGDGKNPKVIVGVVGSAKQTDLRDAAARRMFTPYLQAANDEAPDGLHIEIRCAANAGAMEAAIRKAIQDADGSLRSPRISSSQLLIEDRLGQERLIARLSGFFSLIALVLASVGLYGVMSYLTARRTTEVGVRMALGATRGSVIALIFRQAASITAVGLVAGIAGALGVGKLTTNVLWGVNAFDPITLAACVVTMSAAAAAAVWLPAWRAAKVDPMVSLRSE